jgi:hypothetical protein
MLAQKNHQRSNLDAGPEKAERVWTNNLGHVELYKEKPGIF